MIIFFYLREQLTKRYELPIFLKQSLGETRFTLLATMPFMTRASQSYRTICWAELLDGTIFAIDFSIYNTWNFPSSSYFLFVIFFSWTDRLKLSSKTSKNNWSDFRNEIMRVKNLSDGTIPSNRWFVVFGLKLASKHFYC